MFTTPPLSLPRILSNPFTRVVLALHNPLNPLFLTLIIACFPGGHYTTRLRWLTGGAKFPNCLDEDGLYSDHVAVLPLFHGCRRSNPHNLHSLGRSKTHRGTGEGYTTGSCKGLELHSCIFNVTRLIVMQLLKRKQGLFLIRLEIHMFSRTFIHSIHLLYKHCTTILEKHPKYLNRIYTINENKVAIDKQDHEVLLRVAGWGWLAFRRFFGFWALSFYYFHVLRSCLSLELFCGIESNSVSRVSCGDTSVLVVLISILIGWLLSKRDSRSSVLERPRPFPRGGARERFEVRPSTCPLG
jgi:hypothetical protein